jgi:hypothetical protein
LGCRLPCGARSGLAGDSSAAAVAAPASPPLLLPYPDTPAHAAGNVSQLWFADLDDASALQRGRTDPRAWNDASLKWLVGPGGQIPDDEQARGVRVGMSDVERFRATVDMFARLDDRYGGGHARQALIQYLPVVC